MQYTVCGYQCHYSPVLANVKVCRSLQVTRVSSRAVMMGSVGLRFSQVLIPSVHPEERLLFTHTTLPGIYRAVVRYGYREAISHDHLFVQKISAQVRCWACPSVFLQLHSISALKR